MTTPHIKRPVVYGHPEDDSFETTCPKHAEAYAKVYPRIGWVRERLVDSKRFKTSQHLEGAVKRHIELLVAYELKEFEKPAPLGGLKSVPLTVSGTSEVG